MFRRGPPRPKEPRRCPTPRHPRPTIGCVYEVPVTLSPSRMEAFTSCPLAFRFSSLDQIPEPPSAPAAVGTLVHRALELLYADVEVERDLVAARGWFDTAWEAFSATEDFALLGLGEATEATSFRDRAWKLTAAAFEVEDPSRVRDIGLELRLEAPLGDVTLRGIIDRLELDAQGGLVVTDYKTGRSPSPKYASRRLQALHLYALLCAEVLGEIPRRMQLVYLSDGKVIDAEPDEQSVRFAAMRTHAVWRAIARACETGDFAPRPGPLCNYCHYRPWCPSHGGNPDQAVAENTAATDRGAVLS